MTKLTALIIGCLLFASTFAQSIERYVLSSTGTTLNTGDYQMSFSVGETMILPSPSITTYGPYYPMMLTIGFQQPHVAKRGILLHANNWVSAYPNPTNGWVRLDIHGDNFQTNQVRVTNALGQRVPIPPFVLVNGKIDLRFDNLSAGVYLVSVTDDRTGNTVSVRIIKRNH